MLLYVCIMVHSLWIPFIKIFWFKHLLTLLCVHAQSCLTLGDPMDHRLPGFSVHGIFQAKILGQVAISYSRGSSWPRDQTRVSCVSCIDKRILYHWATWKAIDSTTLTKIFIFIYYVLARYDSKYKQYNVPALLVFILLIGERQLINTLRNKSAK